MRQSSHLSFWRRLETNFSIYGEFWRGTCSACSKKYVVGLTSFFIFKFDNKLTIKKFEKWAFLKTNRGDKNIKQTNFLLNFDIWLTRYHLLLVIKIWALLKKKSPNEDRFRSPLTLPHLNHCSCFCDSFFFFLWLRFMIETEINCFSFLT